MMKVIYVIVVMDDDCFDSDEDDDDGFDFDDDSDLSMFKSALVKL
jgi:hypothetical protein